MSRRYSFDFESDERDPLDNPKDPNSNYVHSSRQQRSPSPSSHIPSQTSQPRSYQDHPSPSSSSESYRYPARTSPTRASIDPNARLHLASNNSRQDRIYNGRAKRVVAPETGTLAGGIYVAEYPSLSGPVPPPHRENSTSSWTSSWGHQFSQPNVTPGADNFSETAAGGMSGLAMSVAERNARESGLEAMRESRQYQEPQRQQVPYSDAYQTTLPPEAPYDQSQNHAYDRNYDTPQGYGSAPYGPLDQVYNSSPSLTPSGTAAMSHSGQGTPTRGMPGYSSDPFRDPRMAYGRRMDPALDQFNPNDIDDDGDDGLDYRRSTRNSKLGLGGSSHRGGKSIAAGATGAAAGAGIIGGLMGRNRNSGIIYDPVDNTSSAGRLGDVSGGYDTGGGAEKQSEWLSSQNNSRKKWKWFILILVGLIIAGGIVGGIVGGILVSRNKSGDSSSASGVQSAASDIATNGDLDLTSNEIQALMNNHNLHKVFPGVDYTPINVQFPECLENPPSQNNVTRDVAVLSQLTNTIRLYGTDCNQTEMTIHALRQLKLEDDIKIWLGVWQDGNDTTNERQLSKMWNILDEYGADPFKGLIIGNEILFREQMTASQLSELLDLVRTNLTKHNWNLPVATSDLGDNWDSQLAGMSDYIMGNIHPFFAGVNAEDAASWTWQFWENKAHGFFKKESEKNVISEIGWPTKGGTNCGSSQVTDCPNGSVAGVDELNTLMESWVCQALENGTNYFWFEMFDEPWKISFDTPGKEWEDQWGLMDVNRNLKEGVKIPDCGGKTV
ncbi:glycoside hydrolase family 17 protein [Daldinia caldariorum]|uniref:glycoside hydrolase family 17 protein n=1 Tax=Daldinia caldariorum TaxID=326644 RepID=UPI00200850FA|nr:glycoside hydrolase family 17 protein [Daldinia caldariorum]KAI1472141.1 glycoside hydrolase family 17 protein [Daldinia caldariorum]